MYRVLVPTLDEESRDEESGAVVFYQKRTGGNVMMADSSGVNAWSLDGQNSSKDFENAPEYGFTYWRVADEGELNSESMAKIAKEYGIELK